MKRSLLAVGLCLLVPPVYAQSVLYSSSTTSNVGIGTTAPNTGAALDMSQETDSILLPVGTTGQRPTGVAGMLRYNSTNSVPEFYTTSWLPLPLTASSPIAIDPATGNITCPSCNTSLANVYSVSGDGSLYVNTASTGNVTLMLANAPAYSVWGNNTSLSSTPAYTTSPQVSGTIADIQTIGSTSTDGLVLINPTNASSGNQEWSPRIRWTGEGWKTNSPAASQEVDVIAELQPQQGTTNPTFNWVLSGQINGTGYAPLLTVPSTGGLNIGYGNYEIGGVPLSAANLSNGTTGSGAVVLANSPSLITPNIGAATGTSLAVTGNITTSSGSVGIGTTIPTSPLTVNGVIQSLTGGVKFPDGTTQTTAATGTGSIKSISIQTFTSSGTYTPSTGMTYCQIRMIGGGGGGGGVSASANVGASAGGGGSGLYLEAILTAAQIGSSQSVTIGSGGSGAPSGNYSGTAGGASSLGTLLIANGGSGGSGANAGNGGSGGTGGSLGSGTAVPSFYVSTAGLIGSFSVGDVTEGFGGTGANGFSGFGGGMGGIDGSASSASGYGAGGGGGASPNTSAYGGSGSSGIVIITEYISQ